MARIMIIRESWVTNRTHCKGFDQFTDMMFEAEVTPLKEVLESGNHEVPWMPMH